MRTAPPDLGEAAVGEYHCSECGYGVSVQRVLPSLRNCNACDGPLGRPLRFDSGAHGFVCGNCGAASSQIIPNDVADVLEAIMRMPVGEFAASAIASDVLIEVRSLAAFFRRNFLGHELKSFEVLAGVVA